MDKKTKLIIGLIGCLIICLFGVYRLVLEIPSTVNSLIIPIVFSVTGFIGFVGNLLKLKKLNNDPLKDNYSQLDFEEAIASIEQVYDSLAHYNVFLNGEKGKNFLDAYELENSEFEHHIRAIQTVIHQYTSSILDLIINNVRQKDISDKLQPFVRFFRNRDSLFSYLVDRLW